MPDLAQNATTGQVLDARELAATQDGINDAWVCPDPSCAVGMIPIACRDADYRVIPHFRARGPHVFGCKADGLRSIVNEGRLHPIQTEMPFPEIFPTVLYLAAQRPQRPAEGQQANGGVVDAYRGQGAEAPNANLHHATASTLRRIAEAFCAYPLDHDRPLRIPGLTGTTYRTCFKRIINTQGFIDDPQKVLYAPIKFSKIESYEDLLTVELNPAVWPTEHKDDKKIKPVANYKVEFNIGQWSEGCRRRFSCEIKKFINIQRENYIKESDWSVFLFFIGTQDENNRNVFRVNDHRLFYLIELNDKDFAHKKKKR